MGQRARIAIICIHSTLSDALIKHAAIDSECIVGLDYQRNPYSRDIFAFTPL